MLYMASDCKNMVSTQRVQLCQVIHNGQYEYFLALISIADPDPSPKPECINEPKNAHVNTFQTAFKLTQIYYLGTSTCYR